MYTDNPKVINRLSDSIYIARCHDVDFLTYLISKLTFTIPLRTILNMRRYSFLSILYLILVAMLITTDSAAETNIKVGVYSKRFFGDGSG